MSDDEDIDYMNAYDDAGYRRRDGGSVQTAAQLLEGHVSQGPSAPLRCKTCNAEAGPSVVVWRPERLCSVCKGKKNRITMDAVPQAIRDLKFGSDAEVAEATRTLTRIFGEADAKETAAHIRRMRDEGKFKSAKGEKGSFK